MGKIINSLYRFLIRISSFMGREIYSILRQPMLVVTLVLGPFLILLLFGIGFRNEPPALRTLFVIDESNSQFAEKIETYASSLGPQLIFMGVTDNPAEATQKLLRREVDLVAHVPSNAYELIRDNKPAMIELNHYEIDPIKIDYIDVFGQVYVDEMNRRILRTVTQQGQNEAASINESVSTARQTTERLRQALEAEDGRMAQQEQQALEQDTNILAKGLAATIGLVGGIQEAVGAEETGSVETAKELLDRIDENTNSLDEIDQSQTNLSQEAEKVAQIDEDLTELEGLLEEFQSVETDILVRPFRSETKSVATIDLSASDFFAPAVIALLLQHLAVTFAALSIVHERQAGTMELFRVSPISPIETLVSKYLSYMILNGILGAILTLAVIYGLGVPMVGSWLNYSLTLAALIFTSLSIGFVISLIAKTDTEAVQYSMILLLTSVFFSGAFVGLHLLWEPVQVVSWAVPATYGIRLLQDIMLRGFLANFVFLTGLTAIGVIFFFLAWFLLQRAMSRD